MPRPKTKEFHYFFRQVSENEVHVSKFEPGDDQPAVTYFVKGDFRGPGRALCDCPAAHRYPERPDKHVGWVRRWIAIKDTKKFPPDQIIYYNSADDRFYPTGGSIMDLD